MRKIKIIIGGIFILAILYSFIPLVLFPFVIPAEDINNNQANIARLKNNTGTYFSFIVFGDNHAGLFLNDASTLKEIWQMNREDRFRRKPIDFVLSAGDVTFDGKPGHFKAYKKIQSLIKYPLIAAIGNHDKKKLFKEACGPADFIFTDRNSYFIIMDDSEGELSENQFKWLESRLKDGQAYQNIFVVMHKPPFDPYQQHWYSLDKDEWTYRFRKLCAAYKVKMVFSGHRHLFKYANFDGVDYIVTGGGGMITEIPDSEGGFLHYVRVSVNHDYVTYEVRRVSPPLWEFILYYIPKELVYWARNFYGSGYVFGK